MSTRLERDDEAPSAGSTQVMIQDSVELERIFESCFLVDHQTLLVGGGAEPVYLPSSTPETDPHRIIYREDFLASALHEVAHWCLAGPDRRLLEDYGYWYAPDGRTAAQQAEFERAEARPQALEWIFSETCRLPFNLSADNLEAGCGPSEGFSARVESVKDQYRSQGLPARAERFRRALIEAMELDPSA